MGRKKLYTDDEKLERGRAASRKYMREHREKKNEYDQKRYIEKTKTHEYKYRSRYSPNPYIFPSLNEKNIVTLS